MAHHPCCQIFSFTSSCSPTDSWILLQKYCYKLEKASREISQMRAQWVHLNFKWQCPQPMDTSNFKIARWQLGTVRLQGLNARQCDFDSIQLRFALRFLWLKSHHDTSGPCLRRPMTDKKIEKSDGRCFGGKQLLAYSIEIFIWHEKKKWLVAARNLQSIKTLLTLELSSTNSV